VKSLGGPIASRDLWDYFETESPFKEFFIGAPCGRNDELEDIEVIIYNGLFVLFYILGLNITHHKKIPGF